MGVTAGSLHACVIASMRLARWGAALSVCLAAASCGGYFDPLHPYDLKPVDTSVTWERHFGDGFTNAGSSVQQTADGGFVLTGYTELPPAGDIDLWLVKTDATGATQWAKTFGGTGWDVGRSVVQTPDGGYAAAGSTKSFDARATDVYLVKTDADGNEEWNKTYGGSGEDEGWCVLHADGGYLIAGSTASSGAGNYDAYLIKTDSLGNQQWERTYGGLNEERGYSVRQTADSGYVLSGLTEADMFSGYTGSTSAGDFDAWLIKTDGEGVLLWDRTFGGAMDDRAGCVRRAPDGGFILTGMTRSSGFYDQAWLIRTDASGVQQWAKTFGGPDNDWGLCVYLTSDGGSIMTGYTESYGGSQYA